MTELERAILQRNTRIRAWKTFGAPVSGGWTQGESCEDGLIRLRLVLVCDQCGPVVDIRRAAWRWSKKMLATDEFAALARQTARKRKGAARCPHLAPLAGEDPQEVMAIYEMELLAGA